MKLKHNISVCVYEFKITKYITYLMCSNIIAYSSISALVHFDVIKELTSGK